MFGKIVIRLGRELAIEMIEMGRGMGKRRGIDRFGRRRATIHESEERKGKENEGLRPGCETDLNDMRGSKMKREEAKEGK